MADWLSSRGAPLGSESNRAYPVSGGVLAGRLAPGEVLLLSSLDGNGETIAGFEQAWTYELGNVWPVPRRDASFWFLVSGADSPTMFAKICGVDLRQKSFRNHSIAQTSVARTNCIVLRDDLERVPAYHLLGDSASAGFMWSSVLDAMQEFGGMPVGLDALLALSANIASPPNV
jgi:sarcosine oxidase subunit gamma